MENNILQLFFLLLKLFYFNFKSDDTLLLLTQTGIESKIMDSYFRIIS